MFRLMPVVFVPGKLASTLRQSFLDISAYQPFNALTKFRPCSLMTASHLRYSSSDSSSSSDSDAEDSATGLEFRKGKPKYLPVDVPTSIEYMSSDEYEKGYGNNPVWFHFKRNLKGTVGRIHNETRKKCTRLGYHATGSPCPICRDEFLVPHFTNTKLLNQFITPTGAIYPAIKTGICKKQHREITIAIMQARDIGILEDVLAVRFYNYKDYYPHWNQEEIDKAWWSTPNWNQQD